MRPPEYAALEMRCSHCVWYVVSIMLTTLSSLSLNTVIPKSLKCSHGIVKSPSDAHFRILQELVGHFYHLVLSKGLWSCSETLIWTLNRLVPNDVHYMEKILECFHQNLINWKMKDVDILDDMGVSKLSAKVFLKKWTTLILPLSNILHHYMVTLYNKVWLVNI